MTASIDCRLFGSLTVTVDGQKADLGGHKQRLLLALLLCRDDLATSTAELIDALWAGAGAPPRTARKNVQVYMCKLRKIFGERLTHCSGGYRLRLGPAESDVRRFRHLAVAGRGALRDGDRWAAADTLGRCLELWPAAALTEFAAEPGLSAELDTLTTLFLTTLEDWAELALEAGEYHAVLDKADGPATRYPLRERLAAVWIRALACSGRIGEALGYYELVRQTLGSELGVDPGRQLSDLHQRLLRGEEITVSRAGAASSVSALPRAVPDFVGREAQLRRAAEELSGNDLAVISGEVGVGKTAFAVHLARLLAAEFPDGQVMLELVGPDGRARSAEALLSEVLCMVGVGSTGGFALPSALARWRTWTADRRLLLVLDGAAREDVVRMVLPGSGPSRTIVTSRRRLSGLESAIRIELPVLTDDEAIDLLARIIGSDRVDAEPLAARGILDLCAGLPLGVRIVGARLTALRHVNLSDYLAHILRADSVLDTFAAGDLEIRSRYRQLYGSLSDAERSAFRLAIRSGSKLDSATETLSECGLISASGEIPAFAQLFRRELNPRPPSSKYCLSCRFNRPHTRFKPPPRSV